MTRTPRPLWDDAEPEEDAMATLLRPRSADRASTCPTPDVLQASQMGVLPSHLQEPIARHVDRCAVCRTLLAALDDASLAGLSPDAQQRIRERIRGEVATSRTAFGSLFWKATAAAAVIAVATIASVLVWQRGERSRRLDASAVFQLDRPTIDTGRGTDLVWRGSPDSGAMDDLGRALEVFRANDFTEAARRLSALVGRYPRNAPGYFWLGVSELFAGANADAVVALETAERLAGNDVELRRETTWYLALGYRRTGQMARAAAKLETLCRSGGSRGARACAGLSEITTESITPRSK